MSSENLEIDEAQLENLVEDLGERLALLDTTRKQMLSSALGQARIVVCSAFRVEELLGSRFEEGSLTAKANRVLAGGQSLARLVEYESGFGWYLSILIAKHSEDGVRDLFLEVPLYGWSNVRSGCDGTFSRALPSGRAAREQEVNSFSSEAIRGLRRLRAYEDELPRIELEASQVFSLKAATQNLLNNAVLDQRLGQDSAQYADVLNRAANVLSQGSREVGVDTSVSQEEIARFLEHISGS